MKSVVLTRPGQFELVDAPKPQIESETDVIVKIARVGICGSDVHYYKSGRIGSYRVSYPFRPGHECAGTVADIGTGVRDLAIGQRVAIDPAISCRNCDQCRQDRQNTCRNLKFLGTPGQIEGCLCEYIVIPKHCLYPISQEMTLDQAVLAEPVSIALYAVKQTSLPKNAKLAILGAGPIGLSVLLTARAEGVATVYMTEKIKERMDIAAKSGADWVGNPESQDVVQAIRDFCPAGVDAVYECAGQQETLDQAIAMLKPGGKLMLIGIPEIERVSFPINTMRRKEITLINVRRQNNCLAEAVDLVASGKINVKALITHHFKPEQTNEAFEMLTEYRDGVVKALIEF